MSSHTINKKSSWQSSFLKSTEAASTELRGSYMSQRTSCFRCNFKISTSSLLLQPVPSHWQDWWDKSMILLIYLGSIIENGNGDNSSVIKNLHHPSTSHFLRQSECLVACYECKGLFFCLNSVHSFCMSVTTKVLKTQLVPSHPLTLILFLHFNLLAHQMIIQDCDSNSSHFHLEVLIYLYQHFKHFNTFYPDLLRQNVYYHDCIALSLIYENTKEFSKVAQEGWDSYLLTLARRWSMPL